MEAFQLAPRIRWTIVPFHCIEISQMVVILTIEMHKPGALKCNGDYAMVRYKTAEYLSFE